MPMHTGYVGDGRAKSKLSRQSLAEWCLQELEAKETGWKSTVSFKHLMQSGVKDRSSELSNILCTLLY
jgi:hypothetical protein